MREMSKQEGKKVYLENQIRNIRPQIDEVIGIANLLDEKGINMPSGIEMVEYGYIGKATILPGEEGASIGIIANTFDGLRVVAIEILKMVQTDVSALDVAVDTGVAIDYSDTGAVVNPFAEACVEAEVRLAPFHSGIAVLIVQGFGGSHAALPPVARSAGRDEPVFAEFGRQITDRIHMACSHNRGGNCKQCNQCDKYFLHCLMFYFVNYLF